jgi:hypothetical protein
VREGTGDECLALTGFYEDYVKRHEFDVFLRKPVDLDDLCHAITSLTRR